MQKSDIAPPGRQDDSGNGPMDRPCGSPGGVTLPKKVRPEDDPTRCRYDREAWKGAR